MHRRRTLGSRIALILLCLLMLLPLAWLLSIAVKTEADVAAFPTVWWPAHLELDNFVQAVTRIDFLGYTRNSLVIGLISAVLTTLSSSYVAFGFAKMRAPGKRIWFALLIGTMMLPPIVTSIPLYIMFAKVGFLNTYMPWVLWGLAGSAFNVFLIRQAYMALPASLEEAALLDGCGYLRIWWRIYLPLVRPVLAAVFVLAFVAAWGDFFMPMLLLDQRHTTLAVATASLYVDEMQRPLTSIIAAGSFLYAIPVLVIFLIFQRYFVQGFATSGLK